MDDPLRMTFADFLAARAALAKQLFNGVRLFLVAHQMAQPKPPRQPKGQPDIITLPGPAE
jgi:hypothetical protein